MNVPQSWAVFMAALLTTFQANAAIATPIKIDLTRGAGSVEFLAVGRPSALKIHGQGGQLRGEFSIEGTVISGRAQVELKTLNTGVGLRNEHMKTKYLEVDRYPEAVLSIDQLDVPGFSLKENKAVSIPFHGMLTLHGKTKSVSGKSKIETKDSSLVIHAEFGVKLSDFGIDVPKYLGITVAEDVEVTVDHQIPRPSK